MKVSPSMKGQPQFTVCTIRVTCVRMTPYIDFTSYGKCVKQSIEVERANVAILHCPILCPVMNKICLNQAEYKSDSGQCGSGWPGWNSSNEVRVSASITLSPRHFTWNLLLWRHPLCAEFCSNLHQENDQWEKTANKYSLIRTTFKWSIHRAKREVAKWV